MDPIGAFMGTIIAVDSDPCITLCYIRPDGVTGLPETVFAIWNPTPGILPTEGARVICRSGPSSDAKEVVILVIWRDTAPI